jgi:hypothetical protein
MAIPQIIHNRDSGCHGGSLDSLQTKKHMKKSNWEWLIVVFVIVLIIGIGIGIYLSTNETPTDSEQKDSQSKLDLIKQKIRALEERIKNELAVLKLTTEMENALSRKVDRICIVLGTIFWLVTISIATAFYLNGFDVLTSILNTAGLVSLTFPLVSIILWRTVDFNSVVDVTRRGVKAWLNKKYGHNPDTIVALNDSIVKNQNELNLLVASTTSD